MSQPDLEALKAWYRGAMRERISELEALREPLADHQQAARSQARKIGHALLGSGATFGFPEITEAGRLVEDAQLDDLVRRVEGLLSVLRIAAHPEAPSAQQRWAWLAATAGVPDEVLAPATDAASAWRAVAEAAGMGTQDLCRRIAERFELDVAELAAPEAGATRLVPPALLRDRKLLPLREDGHKIFVAACDPTDLDLEFQLERVTGRHVVFEVAEPGAIEDAVGRFVGSPAPPTPAPPRAGIVIKAPPAILVVDDSKSSRLLARAVLERKGYTVREAEDGQEALEGLDARPRIDLIVVDLEMPRMDGRAFVRAYRTRPDGADTPIIVLTGAEDPQLEADLIEDGADDYIRKPLDPRLFIARVKATLRRRGA